MCRTRYVDIPEVAGLSLVSLAILKSHVHLAVLLLQHGFDPYSREIYSCLIDNAPCGANVHTEGFESETFMVVLYMTLRSFGSIAQHMMACFIAAGHTLRTEDCQRIHYLEFPDNEEFDIESFEWIKAQFGIHSLKQLCRNCIRDRLRKLTQNTSIMSRLYDLPLPQYLVDYLALAEFSTEQITTNSSLVMKVRPLLFLPRKTNSTKLWAADYRFLGYFH